MSLDRCPSDAELLAEAERRLRARGQKTESALSQLSTVRTAFRDHVSMLLRMGQVPSEHDEQAALIEWCDDPGTVAEHPETARVYAIPNFSGRLGKLTAIHSTRLAEEGRRKGYPDLGLDVPRAGFHGWRGEMKRRKDGRLKDEQREWLQFLTSAGYYTCTAAGWEAMRDHLLHYLTLKPMDILAYPPPSTR